MKHVLTAVVVATLLGCADREVGLVLHAPGDCRANDGVEVVCPLGDLRSARVTIETNTGEVIHDGCEPGPAMPCVYGDFSGFRFAEGLTPQAGLEIRLIGFAAADCGGRQKFYCESPGDHLVDLSAEAFPVDLFCTCPEP
jgi:hypothetical protein